MIMNPPGPFDPNWESLARYQVPAWYLDAKFGIFIHWGVYTVPAFANEWYPRNMYIAGTREHEHHVKTYGPVDQFGYKDFIPQFTAPRFDAGEWASLFLESGAKFVVPVAEHHDGFAMYPTKQNGWHAGAMGPKRDVIGELSIAVRDRGMIFGVSSHRAEHWFFMNGGQDIPSDVQNPEFADFYGPAVSGSMDKGKNPPSEAFMDDWLARCVELIDNYQPQLFWFDWWIEQPEFQPYLKRFASYYYNRAYQWGIGVAINYKHQAFPESAAVYDVERGQLAEIREKFWQTDTAVARNSWSHVEGMDYKSATSLICDLVDIVSKNGALLLNIGPRADGSIPEEDQAILREIGTWLSVNGDAIYGTRPWKTFGEGPTKVTSGYFTDGKEWGFTSEDFRFTRKAYDLFVVPMAALPSELLIRSLGSYSALEPREIESVTFLDGTPASFERTPDGLKVSVPASVQGKFALAMKVGFKL